MKTITLQEALRQTRVLIVPVYEDDAVPASICDALGYDFAHEETGREGKIQRLSTLGRIAVPTLIFAGLGRRAEITYGKAKRCLGSALYACEEECRSEIKNLHIIIVPILVRQHSILYKESHQQTERRTDEHKAPAQRRVLVRSHGPEPSVQVYLSVLLRVEGLDFLGHDEPLLAVNKVFKDAIDKVENYRTNNCSFHNFNL